MSAAFLIMFREVLEMASVLGLLFGALEKVEGARRWIAFGALAGLVGAVLTAVGMESMEAALDGNGEFLFNAVCLMLAATMMAWTVIWMQRQAPTWQACIQRLEKRAEMGKLPHVALATVAFAAVIREGGEAAFFMFGVLQGQADSQGAAWVGGILGALTAMSLGVALHRRLVRVPLGRLFSFTGWLLILVAAGMASQAVSFLVLIDWLPALVEHVWDTSSWLPRESIAGTMLRILIGYDDAPSAMQVMAFFMFLAGVVWLRQRASVLGLMQEASRA